MFNFAIGNQEDSLAEIAKQMRISNSYALLRELWANDVIKEDEYIEKVKKLLESA